MKNYSTAIVLETRTPLKERGANKNAGGKNDEKYPVKLRVIINRKARYYGLGEYMTQDDFKKMMGEKPRKPLKDIRRRLEKHEDRAESILNAMQSPTFTQFKNLYTQREGGGNVENYYLMYIAQLKKDNRHGTASNYECSLNNLKKIKGKKEIKGAEEIHTIPGLSFSHITAEWLEDYAAKMEDAGKSISTVGIYLRPLRRLFNKAIGDGVVSQDKYPFGLPEHGKFSIPTSENRKRPLKRSELEALADYSGPYEKYRDMFLLSYYLMGLNFYDLLTLKWQQKEGETLSIIRTKTKRTSRKKQRAINLYLNEDAQAIIDKYGCKKSVFIFDVIGEKDNAADIRRKVQNFTRITNQALKAIAKKLNNEANETLLNPKISTVFARHTAASYGYKSGASLALISKSLGHSNLQITSNYIDSLDDAEKELAAALSIKKHTVPKAETGTNDPQARAN